MSQPTFAPPAPAPFLRRAFDWWVEQVKHALPPTIFFFGSLPPERVHPVDVPFTVALKVFSK